MDDPARIVVRFKVPSKSDYRKIGWRMDAMTSFAQHNTRAIAGMGTLAGLTGGLAEVAWIWIYGTLSHVDSASVARGVSQVEAEPMNGRISTRQLCIGLPVASAI